MNHAQISSVRMQAVYMVGRVGGGKIGKPKPHLIPRANALVEKLDVEIAALNGEYQEVSERFAALSRRVGRSHENPLMLHEQHELDLIKRNIESLENVKIHLSSAILKAKRCI